MKFILAFALTVCLFACKEKEEVPSLTPGLVGTYELSSTKTKTAYVFQDLLTGYDNFREKVTATIKAGGNTYLLQIQTIGTARKELSNPVNYGFMANMTCAAMGSTAAGLAYSCKGEYSNLTPSNPELDKRSKEIMCRMIHSGLDLEIIASIPYLEDAYPIAESNLIKIK